MSLPVVQERSCGACDVCCVVYDIEEPGLVKKAHDRCEHSRPGAGGCSVYNTRPATCREFKCLWLEGLGPDGDRPDLSGFVLRAREAAELPGGQAIYANELRAGALADGSYGAEVAKEIGYSFGTIITYRDGKRRVIVPMQVPRPADKRGVA